MNIHPALGEIAKIFSNSGKSAYLVGGAVRDTLRGKTAKDFDLATDALPEEVMAIFGKGKIGKVFPTGIKHGTVTLLYKNLSCEVTAFRGETTYSDGRHPDGVKFGVSIEEDLARRDFTMNAIAYKLPSGPLVDPFNGAADIKAKIIRAVGSAKDRFAEDGLRPLRGIRFASQLGFIPDEAMLEAIPQAIPITAKVSAERARDELVKIIASAEPSISLRLMEQTGLLELILPELASCRDVMQKGRHLFDVLDHSLNACDFTAAENYPQEVRIAALFHDIGKRNTSKTGEDGIPSFHRHEKQSAIEAMEIMRRLRFPNIQIDQVCRLIEGHMFHYEDNWTDAAVRRFIIKAGEENLANTYRLRRSDSYGMTKVIPPPGYLLPLQERVEKILQNGKAFSLKDLAVKGDDLRELGIKPGKTMGIILNELLETVIDDPDQNTQEKLLEIAEKLNNRYIQ